jgi:glycine/D-amino acid oxidase-like deaminating enzyme
MAGTVDQCEVVIVGGGFFGCSLAVALADAGNRVVLVEQHSALMTRASYANQARVHMGYHYPRSLLTALRSRVNFPRWVEAYRAAVVDDFEKYYAIGRTLSKVSAAQFREFMNRVGAPLSTAPADVIGLFDPRHVEAVFTVTEFAFDSAKLCAHMREQLQRAKVDVRLATRAQRVSGLSPGLRVELLSDDGPRALECGQLINATYSHLNELLHASNLPLIRLKHELAEMALVDVPPALKNRGVTIMCGPFFSLMPFPDRGLHTLSHVRYTPHGSWQENDAHPPREVACLDRQPRETRLVPPPSAFRLMQADAQRLLPCLYEAQHIDSLWEIKTILPQSEEDDSRPILFKRNWGLPGLHCVLGGKIDNIFDILEECGVG